MGLPARQRRVLDRIEGTLRGSDPRLAALYTIFARLNRDEDMPKIEQLRHGAIALLGRARHLLYLVFGRLIPRQRAVLFFPLAIALAAASIAFAAVSSSKTPCVPVQQVASGGHAPSSKLCRTPPTMYFGH